MAKTPKVLPDFSGGLVTFTDPRDIKDNQATITKNISLRHVGTIKILGRFNDYDSVIADVGNTIEGSGPLLFDNGSEFYSFGTDTKKDGSVASESYLAYVDKNTGKLWVHDATNKKWQYLAPYDSTADVSWASGDVRGIKAVLTDTNMTSNDGLDAAYYFADGALRVTDPNFNNGTQNGPQTMDWKNQWTVGTAYDVNDTVIYSTHSGNDGTGADHNDRQYICLVAGTATNDTHATTGRPIGATTGWKLLEDFPASTLHISHINKNFLSSNLNVNKWHTHPAPAFDLVPSASGNTGNLDSTFNFSSVDAVRNCEEGQATFAVNLQRNKGDGTIQMQGRKFYATFTYDNKQESLPKQIDIITLNDIKASAPALTAEQLGYTTKLSKTVLYGAENIPLINYVKDQGIASTYITSNQKLDWDEAGTIELIDNNGVIQQLGYTGISDGTAPFDNFYNDNCDATTSGTCNDAGAFPAAANALKDMYIKNVNTGESAIITASSTNAVTCPGLDFTSGHEYLIKGATLIGVTGWIDSGYCSISGALLDGSIVVIDGGGDYSGAPTPGFSGGGGSGAAASCTMSGAGSTQSVTKITLTDHGQDYTSPPTITLTGGSASATVSVAGDLTMKQTCQNHGGTWYTANADKNNAVTYDPPGELQEDDVNLGFKLTCSVRPKCAVAGKEQLFDWNRGGNRATHINVYTNKYKDDAGTIAEKDDMAYVCSFDLENGYVKEDSSYNAWAEDGSYAGQYSSSSDIFGSIFATNYQNRTGMFPDTWNNHVRYNDAIVVNRRVYAAGVFMKEKGDSTAKSFPDRIAKSLPNQFDIFTDYDVMDVTVDDGDEIVAIQSFGGQLLQFKKKTLYIIDITAEPEFIRATHRHRGIPNRYAMAQTDFGVAFANKYGAFLYNGETITELTTATIESEWNDFYNNTTKDIVVGFHPEYKVIFIAKGGSSTHGDSEFLIYDMTSRAWSTGFGDRFTPLEKSKFFIYNNELISAYNTYDTTPTVTADSGNSGSATVTCDATSWTKNKDDKTAVSYELKVTGGSPDKFQWKRTYPTATAYSTAVDITAGAQTIEDGITVTFSNATDAANDDKFTFTVPESDGKIRFYKWEEDLAASLSNVNTTQFQTKEFDFGNPSTIKFVYKVYVTYKTSAGNAGNMKVTAISNDGATITTTDLTGSTADTNGEWITGTFVPNPRISCRTLSILIQDDGNPDYGFEINDMTVIYREKSVK
jgi:hypothetical protein